MSTTDLVRDWYLETHPTDPLGFGIDPGLTFSEALKSVRLGSGFYDALGAGDSFVREEIFDELSRRFDVPYDEVYDAWLASRPVLDAHDARWALPRLREAGWSDGLIHHPGADPVAVDADMANELVKCWVEKSNAGTALPYCCGKFWCTDQDGGFTAVDNSSGDCFVEHFEDKLGALDWLHGTGLPAEDFRPLTRLGQDELREAWTQLGDVLVDDDGRLLSDWRDYPAGTDREEVWRDFDVAYEDGVAALMFPGGERAATSAPEGTILSSAPSSSPFFVLETRPPLHPGDLPDALLFRPQDKVSPYVIAHGFDEATGSWGHGTYHHDLLKAACEIRGCRDPRWTIAGCTPEAVVETCGGRFDICEEQAREIAAEVNDNLSQVEELWTQDAYDIAENVCARRDPTQVGGMAKAAAAATSSEDACNVRKGASL